MSLDLLHQALYWPATLALLAAPGLALARRESLASWHVRALGVGLVLLTAAVVPRWVETGHPPIFGTYENSIAAAWSLALACLVLARARGPVAGPLARALSAWLVPLLAAGWFFDRTPYPLTISERSLLVDFHVLFAWSAHTALLGATTAAILVVAGRTREADAEWWDAAVFRPTGYGFAALTLMLAIGSLYSYLLFADWYKWEIVETFAAATWIAYATVLHAAMMFSWRGRRLAWAMLAVLPLMLATFWVWSFYSGTYHHFEIPAIKAS